MAWIMFVETARHKGRRAIFRQVNASSLTCGEFSPRPSQEKGNVIEIVRRIERSREMNDLTNRTQANMRL